MQRLLFHNGTIVLEDRLLPSSAVAVEGALIRSVGSAPADADLVVDLQGGYLVPGFIDLHVHGGDGADFMDGTEEAFRAVCQAHARHGTTSLLPTTTVARHEQHLAFLEVCRRLQKEGTGGARILGAHFYGPYFGREARGCHPAEALRPPRPEEYEQYLGFDCICTATVAPELPGAGPTRPVARPGIRGGRYWTVDESEWE